jgi:multiple sugar transport system ATP-binding protein
LNLEVKDREFMVLVGPSGSGKSTALRMIAGLEEISSGTIAIDGRRVNDVAPRDRNIAMVFQNYALYPHMSVKENLAFGLRLRKTPAAEVEQLVNETAKMLGISALLDRKPKQLSGGERQRVAVGRAIMRKPAVFLFDEPLSNLDAKLRVQMRAEIKKLQNALQTTAIYVTHDQTEAMTMGSRIAVMKDGRLQQVGPPIEVYRRPQNVFVAGFIGNLPMNLVAATLEDRGRRIAAAGFSLESPEPFTPAPGADGRRVVLGIRPEDLRGPAGPGVARISIQVEVCEPIGNEVVVHGRAGGEPLVCVHGADRVPEPGDRLDVAVDLGRIHLFDAGTGSRLES